MGTFPGEQWGPCKPAWEQGRSSSAPWRRPGGSKGGTGDYNNLIPEAGVPCASFFRDMGETMLVQQG